MYKIGQFRRNQIPIESYSTKINYNKSEISHRIEGMNLTFRDPCLNLINEVNSVISIYSYYLRFTVTKLQNAEQKFSIKLLCLNVKKFIKCTSKLKCNKNCTPIYLQSQVFIFFSMAIA